MEAEGRNTYQGVRVLVTGASGFVGRWVASLLAEAGAELWVVGQNRKRLFEVLKAYSIPANEVIVDLGKSDVFREIYGKIKPDATFNLAAYGISRAESDEATMWRINTDLVEEMVSVIARDRCSRWQGLKFVHVGSGFEYGCTEGMITEHSVPNPLSVYGESKLAATKKVQAMCRSSGLTGITARLFTVYGPGEYPYRLLPSLISAAKTGETLKLTGGEQKRDFTYVKDAAVGLLKLGLMNSAAGEAVNLATGKLTSIRDFAECAANLLDMKSSQLHFGAIPYRKDEVWQGLVDVGFLKNCTGWTPTYSISEGILDTAQWGKYRHEH